MFVIAVYDVGEERVGKCLKTMRKYLTWVQNSVLEGEIEEPGLRKLKNEIAKFLVDSEDSVVFYKFRTKQYYEREELGIPRQSSEQQIL